MDGSYEGKTAFIEETDTWELVDLPRGKNVVGCKYFHKIKFNDDG